MNKWNKSLFIAFIKSMVSIISTSEATYDIVSHRFWGGVYNRRKQQMAWANKFDQPLAKFSRSLVFIYFSLTAPHYIHPSP